MPSLLDQINSAPPRVQIYSPGRLVPGTAARARPVPASTRQLFAQIAEESRRRSPFPMGSLQHQQAAETQSPWAGFEERARSSPAYKPNQEAAKQAEGDVPWWRQGLGMVFGNPVVSTLLRPLEVLQIPQRAVTYGIEELDKALGIPTQKTLDDKRGWFEKIFGDEPYGTGQLFDTGHPNLDRALGFTGDMATDPLMWLSGGATRASDLALERASKAGELAQTAAKAEDFKTAAAAAAAKGDVSNLSQVIERGSRLDSETAQLQRELAAMDRRLMTTPAPRERFGGLFLGKGNEPGRVGIEHGRGARAELLGSLSRTSPQLFEDLGADITRAGERGFAAASPELRRALGIENTIRFAGREIPYTEPLARLASRGSGAVRAALNEIPGRNILSRGGKGAEEAFGKLITGRQSDLDPLLAATQLGMREAAKSGREVQSRGYQALRTLSRDLRENNDEAGIRTMLFKAEALPQRNKINQLFADIAGIYEEVTGRKIATEHKLNPDTYVPHMLTGEAKRYLREHADNNAVRQFRSKAGFMKDDLLEGSGYLEKSRKLRPDKLGEPKKFTIGGRELTLSDGSIEELNTQLRQVFPDFKGKFYQDDPILIGEAYVTSLSKQAGRDLAVAKYARSPNPHVTQVTGDLADALEQRNKILSQQQPLLDVIRQGHRPGAAARAPIPAPEMPETINGIPLDEYFASAPAKVQTNEMLDTIIKGGKKYLKATKEDIKASTEKATTDLIDLRDRLTAGLKGTAEEAKAAIEGYDKVLSDHAASLKKLGPLTTKNLDEMVTTLAQVSLRRGEVEQQLADMTTKVISDEVAKQRPQLEKVLRSAKLIEAQANRKLAEGPATVRAEAMRRLEILQAPVKAAEMALNEAKAAAEARLPALDQKQVDAALNTFRRSLKNSKEFDQQMKAYEDAVAGVTPPPVPEVTMATEPPVPPAAPRELEGEVLAPREPAVEAGPLPKREPPAKVRSKWEANTNPNTGNTIWTSDVDGSEIWQQRNSARSVVGYRAFDRNGRSLGAFKTQKEARAAVDKAINERRAAAATREPYRSPSLKLPKTKKPTKKELAEAAAAKARGEEYAARRAARLEEEMVKRQEAEAARRAAQPPMPPSRANPRTFDPRGSLQLTGKVQIPPGLRSPYDEAWAARNEIAVKLSQATTDAERAGLQQQLNTADRSFATGKWAAQHRAREVIIRDIERKKALEADEAVVAARRQLDVQRQIADAKAESVVYVKPAGAEGLGVRVQDPNLGWGAGETRNPLPVDVPREGKVIPGEAPPARGKEPQRYLTERGGPSRRTPAGEFVRRENARRRVLKAETDRLVAKYAEDKDATALVQGMNEVQTRIAAESAADRAAMKAGPEVAPATEQLATRVASEGSKTADDHLRDIASMDENIATLQDAQAELAKLPENAELDAQMLANHRMIRDLEAQKKESMLRLQRVSQTMGATPEESLAKYFPERALEQLTSDKRTQMVNLQRRFDALRKEIEDGATTLPRNELRRKIAEAAGVRDSQNEIIGIKPKIVGRGNAKPLVEYAASKADVAAERKQTALQRLMRANLPDTGQETLSEAERKMLALEKAQPMKPEWFGGDRDIAQAYVDTFAPTMPNPYKGMAEQRVAEQAKRALPAGQEMVAKAQQAVERMAPSVPNLPSTERAAIDQLSQAALSFNDSPAGRALQAQAGQARGRATETAQLLKGENLTKRVTANLDVSTHPELGPLERETKVIRDVEEALGSKAKQTEIRNNAEKQWKSMLNPKSPGKSVEKAQIIDSIRQVARANPDMLDKNLSATEALLDNAGKTYDRVAGLRLSNKEVDKLMDSATRKKGLSDMLLTTVGGNWSMLYEATGAKQAALQSGDYLVSKELHKMMTNLFDISKEPNRFWRGVETLTNIFKTYATLSPGFHVRNALSAAFMNLSDGVGIRTQIEGARLWRRYSISGEPWLKAQPQEIRDAFSAAFGSGAGGRFTEAGFASGGKHTAAEKALANKVTRLSQRVGEKVEGSVRLAMGLDSVRRGDSVSGAIARISRIHFDYGDLSRADETMKRLVPFWTFLSRNLPLQLSQMWLRPKAYLTYERFMNNMARENDAFTPKYWLDAGAWNTGLKVPNIPGLGGAQGLPIYAQPDFGFTRVGSDLADLQDTLQFKNASALSNFNPLFTAPLELWLKKNIYTGQNYDDQSYSTQTGPIGKPIDMLATIFGQKNSSGQVSDAFTNFLMSINPVLDRTARVFPQLTGGGAYGQERQLEAVGRYLGVPARTLTDKQKDSEFWRRFYEQQNAAAALRTAQREVASGG